MEIDVLRSKHVLNGYHKKIDALPPESFDLRSLHAVKTWKYWMLAHNEFPYDKIAERHCLLIPLGFFTEDGEMGKKERAELFQIKQELGKSKEFDAILENLPHNRTVPGQYHLHAVKFGYRDPFSNK